MDITKLLIKRTLEQKALDMGLNGIGFLSERKINFSEDILYVYQCGEYKEESDVTQHIASIYNMFYISRVSLNLVFIVNKTNVQNLSAYESKLKIINHTLKVGVYTFEELLVNPVAHELSPKYTLVLDEKLITSSYLEMDRNDLAIRWFGWTSGNIVKCSRESYCEFYKIK